MQDVGTENPLSFNLQKIRPESFRKPWPLNCVIDLGGVEDEPAFHSSRFKTERKNIVRQSEM